MNRPGKPRTNHNWVDISNEAQRTYTFPGGEEITIREPVWLAVTDKGHRIVTMSYYAFYIPMKWICLEWYPLNPNFIVRH